MNYDILIVGGGLTGLSLAGALRHLPLRIAIIDIPQQAPDNRSIALSHGSRQVFEKYDLWTPLAASAMPIQQVHISEQGRFGVTRFTAVEARVPALGYAIPIKQLHQQLHQSIQHTEWITGTVHAMARTETGWEVQVRQADNELRPYRARFVVAADGAHSTIRQLQNIPVVEQYAGDTAIIANITLARPHNHIAYERFTPTGAIALLPIAEKTYTLIWTVRSEFANDFLALDTLPFIKKLQREFGYRLGKFKDAAPRISYAIKQTYAEEQTKPHLVLLGNAAHTLHPIAAQGFNLGLRDIDCLAALIKTDFNAPDFLEKYSQQRIPDQKKLLEITNSLVRLFSHPSSLIRTSRNLGLFALDLPSPLKQAACRYWMGIYTAR
ncbi:MAG: FAD-dependent monooxygenase [Gammaproteobacteria bacterium]